MWKRVFGVVSGIEICVGAAMNIWPEAIPTEVGFALLMFGVILIIVSAAGWIRDARKGRRNSKVTSSVQTNPRQLDTETRQRLVEDLRRVANEHTNVKIVFWPPQYRPFAQALDGVFNAAGWVTNTNLTPQEPHGAPYRSGAEVRGFNKHLVDAVCVALRSAGVSDTRDNVVPLKISRDNPKFPTSQHKIYLDIGHIEDGPR